MTRKDIIEELVRRTGLTTSQAMHAVNETINIMADALAKEEDLLLRGFATIKTVQRAAKPARDIANGKQIMLPPCKAVKFLASSELKVRINNPKK